jgi:hypothetical protein
MQRPADLTAMDDARIKLIASRVAHSSLPARFQAEVVERTRNNHYFLFLEPTHRWHQYYQYYLKHFTKFTQEQWQQHWREEELEAKQRSANSTAATAAKSGFSVAAADKL